VGKAGTQKAQFERDTWPELSRLASDVPEAGIHFQDTIIYNREKDVGTATGEWFAELLKTDAWFKDVVPNVRNCPRCRTDITH
jgi:D-amino-acid oxidase